MARSPLTEPSLSTRHRPRPRVASSSPMSAHLPLLLVLAALLYSVATAQAVLKPLDGGSTDSLTVQMYYCASCYPNSPARQAYCHRLALAKYFRGACALPGCVATSNAAATAASAILSQTTQPALPPPPPPFVPNVPGIGLPVFGSRVASRLTTSSSGPALLAGGTLSRQATTPTEVPPVRPGIGNTPQCRAFGTQFVNPGPGVLADEEDAQIASSQLASELVVELRKQFAVILPGLNVSVDEIIVIFDKVRPSNASDIRQPVFRILADGVPDFSDNFALSRQAELDDLARGYEDGRLGNIMTLDGPSNDNINKVMQVSGGNSAGLLSMDNERVKTTTLLSPVGGITSSSSSSQQQGEAARAERDAGAEDGQKKEGSASIGATVKLDLSQWSMRQNFARRRPQATRVTISFNRRVRDGRVRQAFRLLMRRKWVLRVYRPGFNVVKVNPFKYHFKAFFREPYKRVYNLLRTEFARRQAGLSRK